MARVSDPAELARLLRGDWVIRATTFPYWRSPERQNARLTFEIEQASPLILRETYEYYRPDTGDREFMAHAAWKGDHFSWTADGASRAITTATVVSETPATPDLLTVHFGKSKAVRDGAVNILARPHLDPDKVRAMVARDTHSFELSAAEFRALNWLPVYRIQREAIIDD